MSSHPEFPSSTITEQYGHDHARLDDLLLQFERLNKTDVAEAISLFAEFKTGLERHIRWEEEILFPIFETKTQMCDNGPTAVMRQEHAEIKDYLEQIQAALAQRWPAPIMDVLALQDLLLQHHRKEENILYPTLDSTLNATERAKVFADMGKGFHAHSNPTRACNSKFKLLTLL